MTETPNQLDPLTLPLTGMRLIEASAGTGKTYTITGLYLRLLLGHGGENAYPTPLSVDQILVVTFTEAATAELRDRIRNRIHVARAAFSKKAKHGDKFQSQDVGDDLIEVLIEATDDHALAAKRLLEAERQMDEAAIYTIHGFCQRMLSQNAFESGALFDNEFITDESRLRFQAVADYWRRRFYPLDASLAHLVRQEWKSPHDLHHDINTYLSGSEIRLTSEGAPQDLNELHDKNVQRINDVKSQWQAEVGGLHSLISESGVNKRSYTKTSLPKALQEVSNWADTPTKDYQLPKALEKFTQAVLVEKTAKGEPPIHPIFDAIEALLETKPSLRAPLTADAITHCRQGLRALKEQQSWLSFDDLLTQLSGALSADQGAMLSSRIRSLYPVAMIDEFQDTDPLQYHIFSSVYGNQPIAKDPTEAESRAQDVDTAQHSDPEIDSGQIMPSGLLMIGDPKQAIYAFRGADIFTYIQARRQVTDHYTLGTNWRSSAAMVEASNAIFAEAERPFIYDDDIPFLPVSPSPKAHDRGWWVGGNARPAMQVWSLKAEIKVTKKGEESQPFSAENYRQEAALSTAREIARLLKLSQQGEVVLGKPEAGEALTSGNIAILVRTGHEARTVQRALTQYGVDSVYLSNRDSVFSQPVATELLRLLTAAMEPENEQSLRAALATPLFATSAEALDALNHSEILWENAVSEFRDYAQTWSRRGVMPMLRQLLFRRGLTEQLLAEENGERVLTDLLHLGELLQAERQLLDSDQALLRWFEQQLIQPAQPSDEQQVRLESERNLVQIVTIHKSKGLEYDLVFLPFISHYRAMETAIYHDDSEGQSATVFDVYQDPDNVEKAEQERLAEDLRLLYVAITRAVYGCYLCVAPIRLGRSSKEPTGNHRTAIGWLWQGGLPGSCADWQRAVEQFVEKSGATIEPLPDEVEPYVPNASISTALEAAQFQHPLPRNWWVTSYSGLAKQGHTYDASLEMPGFDNEVAEPVASTGQDQYLQDRSTGVAGDDFAMDGELPMDDSSQMPETASLFATQAEVAERGIAQFPKGAGPGTFLHTLFELIDFTAPADCPETVDIIEQQLTREGYELEWSPVLQKLIHDVLNCKLDGKALVLKEKTAAQRLTEMEFMFPIEKLSSSAVNTLLATHDPIAAKAHAFGFDTVSGMLKGFIDLIFEHEGRYYVLDWKSNWLGEHVSDYTPENLHLAIMDHRYDLQYLIYTLALHRYLQSRIVDYDYERHIGGVYYLFLRGIEAEGQHGIYSVRPPLALIEGLDRLMKGEAL